MDRAQATLARLKPWKLKGAVPAHPRCARHQKRRRRVTLKLHHEENGRFRRSLKLKLLMPDISRHPTSWRSSLRSGLLSLRTSPVVVVGVGSPSMGVRF